MKNFKLSSNFVILDVENGRQALAKHFTKRPPVGECPEKLRVPVTITGYIDDAWGDDDGISQEFSVQVDRVQELALKSQEEVTNENPFRFRKIFALIKSKFSKLG